MRVLHDAIYRRCDTWFIHEPQRIDWFPAPRLVWGSDIDLSRNTYKAILHVDFVDGITSDDGTVDITYETHGYWP